jgi:hypothetical protein
LFGVTVGEFGAWSSEEMERRKDELLAALTAAPV